MEGIRGKTFGQAFRNCVNHIAQGFVAVPLESCSFGMRNCGLSGIKRMQRWRPRCPAKSPYSNNTLSRICS